MAEEENTPDGDGDNNRMMTMLMVMVMHMAMVVHVIYRYLQHVSIHLNSMQFSAC